MADEDRITIAELDPVVSALSDAEVPAMRGGLTFKLALSQIATLFGIQAIVDAATALTNRVTALERLPTAYIGGLTTSNNAADAVNDIDVAPGRARDSTDTADIVLTAAMTKRLDAAWAAGTGNGGRDTGSIGDGLWAVWAIYNPTTKASDVIFSLSFTAPTLPTDWTKYRLLASIKRASGAIVAFKQVGDVFDYAAASQDVDQTNAVNTRVLYALPSVPPLARAKLRVTHKSDSSGSQSGRVSDPAEPDSPTSGSFNYTILTSGTSVYGNANLDVRTDSSKQVAVRTSGSTGNRWVFHVTGFILDKRSNP